MTSAAVVGALLLVPATAQATGPDPAVPAPPSAAIPDDAVDDAPISEEVEVEQTPVEAAPEGAAPQIERNDVEPFRMAGVTWDAGSEAVGVTVRAKVRIDGTWGPWQSLEVEEAAEGGRPGSAPLWTEAPADAIAVDVRADSGTPEGVEVTTIDPGEEEVVNPVRTALYRASDEDITEEVSDGRPSVVPMPTIITRKQWKAGSGTSCSNPRTRPKSLGAVIHHTAGSNTYSKAESAGLVRSYQSYHVKGHGWCDIGYNFLIDRFGQIFEGRKGGITNQVRAAHSGVDAVNQYATGISLMGHFDHTKPSAAMQSATVKLVGWRLKYFGANPKSTYQVGGRTYQVINGHRDVKSTACPGKHAHAWLGAVGGLRDRTATYISKAKSAAGAPVLTSSYATPTNVRVSTGTTTASVSWNAVAGAPGYRILVSPTGSTANARYYRSTGTSVSISGLPSRTSFVYRVAVYDQSTKKRLSKWTSRPWATASTAAFVPPTGIKVTKRAATGLKMTWTAQAGAPGYRVQLVPYGQTKPKRYMQTYTNSVGIGKLAKGTRYRIRVAVVYPATKERVSGYTGAPYAYGTTKGRAVGGSSGSAGPAAPAKTFQPPTGIRVTKRAATGLKLAWNARSGAPGYRVQLVPYGQTKPKRYMQTSTNSVGIGKLKSGTRYRIRVAVVRPSTKERLGPYTKAPYPTGVTKSKAKAPAPTTRNTVTPSGGSVTFKGHGYGHGIGMSQYGAEGGARAGKKYAAILSHYYPGTKMANKSATIRVLISADTTNSVQVKPKSGLGMRTLGNGKLLALPSKVDGRKVSYWSIDRAASNTKRNSLSYKSGSRWYEYRNFPADAQFEGPTSISLVMPNGSVQSFRGALRSTKPSSTSRDTVNVLGLEDYTRGVVAREMPSSWSLEALKAQSVAARTFGSRYLGSSRHYDICDTVSCQVYGGVSAETSRTNQAIDGTRGKILTYGGAPALTQFSSSSGGHTNVGSTPYLRPISDPWDNWSGNKNHSWSHKVSASTIQRAYPIGTLRSLTVTKRNGYGDQGGRVVAMTIKGSKGSRTITGVDARWAFGLKSDWFGF